MGSNGGFSLFSNFPDFQKAGLKRLNSSLMLSSTSHGWMLAPKLVSCPLVPHVNETLGGA
jgi:hypothetical protein